MPGYSHPCRYCDQLVPPDSNTCPFCGKVNPTGSLRCPKCCSPIRKAYKACDTCGLVLTTVCPECLESTFFGDYCDRCGARLVVTCPHPKCRKTQPPLGGNCMHCGQPMTSTQR